MKCGIECMCLRHGKTMYSMYLSSAQRHNICKGMPMVDRNGENSNELKFLVLYQQWYTHLNALVYIFNEAHSQHSHLIWKFDQRVFIVHGNWISHTHTHKTEPDTYTHNNICGKFTWKMVTSMPKLYDYLP